jgi:Glycosyltransferase Family 4
MKILLLAPQPFYQDRGTPIAVSLLLRALSERGDQVDVVTYHEGRNVKFRHVTLHRTIKLSFIRNIRPGLSWKKIMCDFLLFLKSAHLVQRNRYDLIFAVEEAVFIALVWKWIFNIPYVYDMDSSLSQQMVEKFPFLAPVTFLFRLFEGVAVRNAAGVAPVCEALTAIILTYKPRKVVVLQDIACMPDSAAEQESEATG